jgi:predicted dehydrogenase
MSPAPTRWGIAGTGSIAAKFAQALARVEGAELAAVASRSVDRAAEFAGRWGAARAHGSYEDLAADDGVDVVYVATPHARHCADTLLYLGAGRHVLCEKPFAMDAAQARTMATAARERGLFLMEALWSRFLPSYVELRAQLSAGRIGEPTAVEATFGFPAPVAADHRLLDPALGGGALLDLGVYCVQLASLVLGPPDRVSAVAHLGPTGVDLRTALALGHPSGAVATAQVSLDSLLACTARITGTEGWIDLRAPMHSTEVLVIGRGAGTEPELLEVPSGGDGLRFQAEEVQRCLAAGHTESPVMALDETIAIAATLDRAREAIGLSYPGL